MSEDIRDMIDRINIETVSLFMRENPDIILIQQMYLDSIEKFLKEYPLKDILTNAGNDDILRSLGFKEIILGDYDEYMRIIDSFDNILTIINQINISIQTYPVDNHSIRAEVMKKREFFNSQYKAYLVPSIFSRFVYNTDGVTYYDIIKHNTVDSTRHAFDFRTTLDDHPGYSRYAVRFNR